MFPLDNQRGVFVLTLVPAWFPDCGLALRATAGQLIVHSSDMGCLRRAHVGLLSGCCAERISWGQMSPVLGQNGAFRGLSAFFFCFEQIAVIEVQLVASWVHPKVGRLPEHGIRFLQSRLMRLYEHPSVTAEVIAAWGKDRGADSGTSSVLLFHC